jgi:hypothetical protein
MNDLRYDKKNNFGDDGHRNARRSDGYERTSKCTAVSYYEHILDGKFQLDDEQYGVSNDVLKLHEFYFELHDVFDRFNVA